MSYENSMPIRFRPQNFGVTADNANLRLVYAPEDCALLWLDPDVWPASIEAQLVIRSKTYNWVINPFGTSSSYPNVTHPLTAAARTKTFSAPVNAAILSGSTYTLPVSNAMSGTGPNGRAITAGTVSSGTGPEGWPNNYYTAANSSEVLSTGLSYTATDGDHRTVVSGVSLTMHWGMTDLAGTYSHPLYFSFLRNAPAIADVTGVHRAWTATVLAAFTFSGNWEKFLFAGGVWNSMGTGTYTATRFHIGTYRRTLTMAALNSIDPTGAFNWLSSTYDSSDDVFDFKRNDIFSVTGRTF